MEMRWQINESDTHRRGKMIKKLTLTIVCLCLLWGCAATPPQRAFKGNTFTSDFPKLKVKIHKSTIWNQGKNSKRSGEAQIDWWWWSVRKEEGVGVVFNMYGHSTRRDYYYSLETIARNWDRIPLKPLLINEHKWLKYAYVTEQKYLHTGFFTRKGDCFISVYRYAYLAGYMDEIEKLDKTRGVTDSQKELLDIIFNETDKLFTIEY
jgi:hypothetical protein